MNTKIDIVIPVYNEGENISRALNLIFAKVKVPFHILIVYDFDADTTVAAVNSYLEENSGTNAHITLLKNKFGRGALNAIKTGLSTANSKYVVVTMADLSDPPEVINLMVEKAAHEDAAIVCGSRYMPGGSQIGGPLLKRALSRIAGLSLYYMVGFPTHDITNSFKLYKKSFLESIKIESRGGFELGMEIAVKGWISEQHIAQVPTTWTDRSNGKSNFKLIEWMPHYLSWYMMAMKFHLRRSFLKTISLMGPKD